MTQPAEIYLFTTAFVAFFFFVMLLNEDLEKPSRDRKGLLLVTINTLLLSFIWVLLPVILLVICAFEFDDYLSKRKNKNIIPRRVITEKVMTFDRLPFDFIVKQERKKFLDPIVKVDGKYIIGGADEFDREFVNSYISDATREHYVLRYLKS